MCVVKSGQILLLYYNKFRIKCCKIVPVWRFQSTHAPDARPGAQLYLTQYQEQENWTHAFKVSLYSTISTGDSPKVEDCIIDSFSDEWMLILILLILIWARGRCVMIRAKSGESGRCLRPQIWRGSHTITANTHKLWARQDTEFRLINIISQPEISFLSSGGAWY